MMPLSLSGPALLLALAAFSVAAPSEHLVTSLPGLNTTVGFKQYAGYVEVSESRRLFYWFVESQRDPSSDPVALWLNGGPGGSSLLGFLEEHGPFRPNADGATLSINEWSWNRVANVLYLEQPVGVGFSYTTEEGLQTSDRLSGEDSYTFLLNWFKLYPEYRTNELYLTGESYAGHFLPWLATEILHRDTSHQLNVAGMLVGNPAIHMDWYLGGPDVQGDSWGVLSFLYNRAMMSQTAFAEAQRACGWERYLDDCSDRWNSPSLECMAAITAAYDEVPRDIDVYNVNAPICIDQGLAYTSGWSAFARNVARRRAEANLPADPCETDYMEVYMNRPDVQKALHARPTAHWKHMSDLNYSMADKRANMAPLYEEIVRRSGWRVMVFSGDLDAMCPFIATQKFINCLGLRVTKGYRAWHIDKQVAGGITEYEGITFLTIKGTGHMVPWYTPEPGFEFFARWIQNQPM